MYYFIFRVPSSLFCLLSVHNICILIIYFYFESDILWHSDCDIEGKKSFLLFKY